MILYQLVGAEGGKRPIIHKADECSESSVAEPDKIEIFYFAAVRKRIDCSVNYFIVGLSVFQEILYRNYLKRAVIVESYRFDLERDVLHVLRIDFLKRLDDFRALSCAFFCFCGLSGLSGIAALSAARNKHEHHRDDQQ